MAATAQRPAPPRRLFTFLKNGALLPVRSFLLFAQLSALSAASHAAVFLLKSLATHTHVKRPPLAARGLDASPGDSLSHGLPLCLRLLLGDDGEVAIATIRDAVEGLVKVAAVSATVASCSGQRPPSVASCLGEVNGGRAFWVLDYLATDAIVFVLRAACLAGLAASLVSLAAVFTLALRVALYLGYSPPVWTLLLFAPLLPAAALAYCVLDVVCAVAAVVSVAEPGRCGTGAVRRAWRLVRGGRKAQLALCAAATWAAWALRGAVLPATLAAMWSPETVMGEIVCCGVGGLLASAVDVLTVAIVTAYYLECTMTSKEIAGHIE